MPLSDSQLATLPTPLAGCLRALSSELSVASAAASRLDHILLALPSTLSEEFWFQVQDRISNLATALDYLGTALGDPPLLSALLEVYTAALQNTLDELLTNPHYLSHLVGTPSSQA